MRLRGRAANDGSSIKALTTISALLNIGGRRIELHGLGLDLGQHRIPLVQVNCDLLSTLLSGDERENMELHGSMLVAWFSGFRVACVISPIGRKRGNSGMAEYVTELTRLQESLGVQQVSAFCPGSFRKFLNKLRQ
jgi:hypothetical protein